MYVKHKKQTNQAMRLRLFLRRSRYRNPVISTAQFLGSPEVGELATAGRLRGRRSLLNGQ